MLRHLLVLFPAVVLAMPAVASAGPLATSTEEASYKPGKKPGKKPTKPETKPETGPGTTPGTPDTTPGEDSSREAFDVELDLCLTVAALTEGRSCRLMADGALVCTPRHKPGKKPGKKPGTKPTEPGGGQPTTPDQPATPGQPTTPDQPATPDDGGGTQPGDAPHEEALVLVHRERCAALGVEFD